MDEIGFDAIQNNICHNKMLAVTRGMHAEPWYKYISLASGQVYAAWVDLRGGGNFGMVQAEILTPDMAVLVPPGVANGYQTLEEDTIYTYLVDSLYEPGDYPSVYAFDPDLGIDWPYPREQAILSNKDFNNPFFKEVTPL